MVIKQRGNLTLIIPVVSFLVFSVSAEKFSFGQERSGYVSTGRDSLYYEVYGRGFPLVVLHGGPGLDHTYLLPQMLSLSKKCELIFYDQRASGKSGGDVDSASITIEHFVNDLDRLREGLHLKRINILGHSWGGLLAMEYAIRYPVRVRKIILVSSIGPTPEWEIPFTSNREGRRTPNDSAALAGIMASGAFINRVPPVMEQFARLFFRSYFYNQNLADSLTITFSPETSKNFLAIFALMSREFARYDISSELSKLTCPVLILHGEEDPIPLETAKLIQSSIPGSKLVALKKCGHFPFVEAPVQFFRNCQKFLVNGR